MQVLKPIVAEQSSQTEIPLPERRPVTAATQIAPVLLAAEHDGARRHLKRSGGTLNGSNVRSRSQNTAAGACDNADGTWHHKRQRLNESPQYAAANQYGRLHHHLSIDNAPLNVRAEQLNGYIGKSPLQHSDPTRAHNSQQRRILQHDTFALPSPHNPRPRRRSGNRLGRMSGTAVCHAPSAAATAAGADLKGASQQGSGAEQHRLKAEKPRKIQLSDAAGRTPAPGATPAATAVAGAVTHDFTAVFNQTAAAQPSPGDANECLHATRQGDVHQHRAHAADRKSQQRSASPVQQHQLCDLSPPDARDSRRAFATPASCDSNSGASFVSSASSDDESAAALARCRRSGTSVSTAAAPVNPIPAPQLPNSSNNLQGIGRAKAPGNAHHARQPPAGAGLVASHQRQAAATPAPAASKAGATIILAPLQPVERASEGWYQRKTGPIMQPSSGRTTTAKLPSNSAPPPPAAVASLTGVRQTATGRIVKPTSKMLAAAAASDNPSRGRPRAEPTNARQRATSGTAPAARPAAKPAQGKGPESKKPLVAGNSGRQLKHPSSACSGAAAARERAGQTSGARHRASAASAPAARAAGGSSLLLMFADYSNSPEDSFATSGDEGDLDDQDIARQVQERMNRHRSKLMQRKANASSRRA